MCGRVLCCDGMERTRKGVSGMGEEKGKGGGATRGTHVLVDLVHDNLVGDVGGDEHVGQVVDGQHALQPVRFLLLVFGGLTGINQQAIDQGLFNQPAIQSTRPCPVRIRVLAYLAPAHEEVERAGQHQVAQVHPDQHLFLHLHGEEVDPGGRGLQPGLSNVLERVSGGGHCWLSD